VHAPG